MAVLLGVLALTGLSTWVWVTASAGSKEAELGSSLFSGLVVGVSLLVVGKMFDRTARQGQSDLAMQQVGEAAPEEDSPDAVVVIPATGQVNVEANLSATGTVQPGGATDAAPPGERRFELVYESVQRDTTRLDAQQIRLRLFEIISEREQPLYTQFVTIPVPSPELRRLVGADPDVTEGRLWWHIAHAIKPQLIAAIQRGNIPTATPSFAFEVAGVDMGDAVRRARQDRHHEVRVNEPIYAFTAPSRTSREEELTMQIRQIVGYESAIEPLLPDGPHHYKMELGRSLTPPDEHRLGELALYNGIQIEFSHGEDHWTVGSAGS